MYDIAEDCRADRLITAVNQKLQEGWDLVGGVAIKFRPDGADGQAVVYMQAMILRES